MGIKEFIKEHGLDCSAEVRETAHNNDDDNKVNTRAVNYPCITEEDIDALSKVEVERRRRGDFDQIFPCAECDKWFHLFQERKRANYVAVWWLQQTVDPPSIKRKTRNEHAQSVGALGDFTETVLLSPVTAVTPVNPVTPVENVEAVEANNGKEGGLRAWGEWIKKYDISEDVKVLA